MASTEQIRRDNVTEERTIVVEKDRVPKMASHFESLAEKVKEASDVHHEGGTQRTTITEVLDELPTPQFDAHVVRVGGVEFSSALGENQVSRHREEGGRQKNEITQGKGGQEKQETSVGGIEKGKQEFVGKPEGVKSQVHGGEQKGPVGEEITKQHSHVGNQEFHGEKVQERQSPSLEEISRHRQTAQQNSMDAIRAAEEKFQKAKQSASQGLGNTTTYVKQKGGETMDAVKQGMQSGTQFVAQKGQQGYQTTKETVVPAAQKTKEYVADKSQQGYQITKDTVVPAAQKTKEYVAEKALGAKDYVADKAVVVKDTATDTGMSTASYVQTKAGAAKDVTVESGKSATGYVGEVAGTVKDTAKVAGWGAAHYTLEKTAEATKAVANVASGVAVYAGEKAVQAKDVVAGAGQKAAHFAGEKIAAVKDVVVSTEESAAEYAARKKDEAQREAETKKASESKGDGIQARGEEEERISETVTTKQGQTPYHVGEVVQDVTETMVNEATETMAKPAEIATKEVHGKGNQGHEGRGVTGVVLNAIGETIYEIGQTTKVMITGERDPLKHEDEYGSNKKHSSQ